jgi:RNA polymerase sigma factor (sigma-70 family)
MIESQLLIGCLRHEQDAQKKFYQHFSPKMLGVCYRYARNKADAEDMLQEGFIKVFQMLHQFRGDGSLEGWIRRIVVHTCINILKKNKKFAECLEIEHAFMLATPHDAIPSITQAKDVVECIRSLPIGYRTVLNLFAIEGYSHKEIADMLGIRESTSRSQYARAKAHLEIMLERRGILPNQNKRPQVG